MKNSIMKKIIIVFVIIVLLLLILFACTKQKDKENISTDDTIKWSIKLTDKENNIFSETNKVKFSTEENNYISINKIAPGSSATAKLILDPTGSNVPIDYSIAIDVNEFKFIEVKSVKATIDGNQYIELIKQDGKWLPKEDIGISLDNIKKGKKVTIEVVIFWNDKNQNNEEDTNVGINKELIEIDITVNAEQHID